MEFHKWISKKYKLITIILFLLLTLTCTNSHFLVDSQLVYVPSEVGLVTILPPIENHNLRMTEANISITVEMREVGDFIIPITYDSNYSIFNPDNTKNISIVIPFNEDYDWIFDDFDVWINETEVDVDICEDDFRNELRSEFPDYYFRCLNNVILPGNSSIIIRIYSELIIGIPLLRNPVNFSILHDVNTANYWEGNINSSIEINVYSYQPLEYSNYSSITPERKCLVTQNENSSIYSWEWENERIKEENVYVKWTINRNKPFTFLADWSFSVTVLLLITASLILIVLRLKMNKKEKCPYE